DRSVALCRAEATTGEDLPVDLDLAQRVAQERRLRERRRLGESAQVLEGQVPAPPVGGPGVEGVDRVARLVLVRPPVERDDAGAEDGLERGWELAHLHAGLRGHSRSRSLLSTRSESKCSSASARAARR